MSTVDVAFCHDQNSDSVESYESIDKAVEAAEEAVEEYRVAASHDNEWPDGVEEIRVSVVTHRVEMRLMEKNDPTEEDSYDAVVVPVKGVEAFECDYPDHPWESVVSAPLQAVLTALSDVGVPRYDESVLSELLYTLSEHGGPNVSTEDAEVLFRALILAARLTDEDVEPMRM